MKRAFFIVGPTAAGKSEIAAEVACACEAEVVSVDAFQIYHGLDLLTAKPDGELLGLAPHHLIGLCAASETMNAERFRTTALNAIADIQGRGKPVIVVGGSGMYVKALTHGLSPLPAASAPLRVELDSLTTAELHGKLHALDPATAAEIDAQNRRRLVRALEICLLTGRPASEQRGRSEPSSPAAGVFVFRDREELYQRINQRVETMFANGVVEEVRATGDIGETAGKTLGLEQIRALIAGEISEAECIAQIQQATRRYAKRQLTWFSRQTNFEPLNLSKHGVRESIELITRKARLSFAQHDD
jgi:tRNA dimethylallyltransferase